MLAGLTGSESDEDGLGGLQARLEGEEAMTCVVVSGRDIMACVSEAEEREEVAYVVVSRRKITSCNLHEVETRGRRKRGGVG